MPKLLDEIQSPGDLKRLPPEKLPQLADEVRALILEVVSQNGGHLASNLGAVELTLALHYVFDSPRDTIIWDVGHQCYTHKILTGRKARFHTLRQHQGILGFPDRNESEHDIYNTGHASTALSAALGIAVARNKRRDDHKVIAVVGDGALTSGVAWEALNQIGILREPLIIVLNYNEMSISANVGALSKYLTYLVSGQHYLRIKDQTKSILKSIPAVGWPLIKVGRALEDTVKKVFFPGLVFEELGIRYVGPVQGHSLTSLLEVFRDARTYDGPVLIHCVTQKGRGYAPAQSNPERFHGAAPFNRVTGEPLVRAAVPTYSAVFGKTLCCLARQDERIIAITAAMPEGTGLSGFAREFPGRFYDVGIAEQHAVNFAAGLALRGLKPVVAIYSTFLQRAYDQLYHDVALQDLPVVFVLDRAGIVSDDGPTHQGINDIVYLRHLPHMILMAPKDENELQRMLKSAFTYGHPSAVRFPKGRGRGVALEEDPQKIELGRSERLKEGKNLLLAFGSTVPAALEAALELEKEGLSLAVVNARFAKPLDEEAILSYAQKGSMIVTVEEGIVSGGFGSAVREFLDRERRFDIRFLRIGLPDEIYPLGKADEIKGMFGLDSPGLSDRIRRFWRG
ncbi:MAG: 1-deoxy-D-xylulose-5-phosphate synthase [Candidatus Aminicenantes bacterium]|nr:1-deoxy-D-xylulose-5-phosphate synthase [Candidatus Aminicenantes bacterium]